MGLWALMLACWGGVRGEVGARTSHYEDWPLLLDAVRAGDVAAARERARDLASGAAGDSESEARLGSALGLLQMAGDADELSDGAVAAAAACRRCHEAANAPPPPVPDWLPVQDPPG